MNTWTVHRDSRIEHDVIYTVHFHPPKIINIISYHKNFSAIKEDQLTLKVSVPVVG